MPGSLIQRGLGNRDYQEVGPEYPFFVQVRQTEATPLLITTSRVYTTEKMTVPGIGTGAAYASGQAFGGKFAITVPKEGTISNVWFLDYDDEGIPKEIALFTRDFTATADKSAFSVSAGDLANSIGLVEIGTFYDFTATRLGAATPALWYNAPEGRIYCQVKTKGADNIAAGSIPQIVMVIA